MEIIKRGTRGFAEIKCKGCNTVLRYHATEFIGFGKDPTFSNRGLQCPVCKYVFDTLKYDSTPPPKFNKCLNKMSDKDSGCNIDEMMSAFSRNHNKMMDEESLTS